MPYTLAKHLQSLLPALGVDVVFDVGANQGQFARRLREIGYKGWILSFEPNPALSEGLRSVAVTDPRWRVLDHALGDEDSMLTLHVTRSDDLASALPANPYAEETFGMNIAVMRDVEVSVLRLDGMYEALQQEHGFARPFLKMDTQGFDLHVLRGAEGVWPTLAGVLTEMSLKPIYDGMPDITESLDAVRQAGFEVTGIFPVAHDSTGALIEIDCVARRRG